MSTNAPLSPAARAAALVLHVDSVTGEVVTALGAAGIRTVLLKGPSTASWLYRDGAARPYVDSDLLVAPSAYGHAKDVLRELGFRPLGYFWWHRDSQEWVRLADRANVDLHRSLVGALASPETVWHELAADTDTLSLSGLEVEVLRIPARALHVALHAAQHGVDHGRPLEDLARALRVTNEEVWYEAADLARRIDALPAFATGLRLDPDGARLAETLRLPVGRPSSVAVQAGSDVPAAIALESLLGEQSARVRARVLFRAALPSALYMRRWSAMRMTVLPTRLRRRPLGLVLAYLWRPIWVLLRLPGAISALRRARRTRARDNA